jgi:hypothetical protein
VMRPSACKLCKIRQSVASSLAERMRLSLDDGGDRGLEGSLLRLSAQF